MTEVPPSGGQPAEVGSSNSTDGSLKDQAVSNGVWALISLMGKRAISFLSVAILSRILFDDYGAVAALMTVLFFLEAGLDLGLGAAVIYEQEEGQSKRVDVAFTANLGVAALLGGAVFLAAPALGSFFHVEEFDDMFRVLGVAVFVRGFFQIPDALLKRDLRFRSRTAVTFARALTRMVVAVGLAAAGVGVMSVAWGLLVAELVGSVGVIIQTHYRVRLRMDWPVMQNMLRFAGAILGIRFASQLAVNGDYLVVGSQLGDTALGFYFNAFRLPELTIMAVGLAFSDVALPVFSRARTGGAHKLQSGFTASLELLCLYGFPAAVGLAVNAESAVRVVFGPGWEPSADPMVALSLAAGVMAIGFASGDIYVAVGRPKMLLMLIIVHIPIQFALLFAGTNWGITGVAYAQLLSVSIAVFVRVVVAARIVDVPVRAQARSMVPGIIAALGVALFAVPVVLWLETGLVSLVLGTISGVAGATVMVRVFAPESFAAVLGMVARLVRRGR
jgi:PST family polysaccharide transporter